MSDSQMTQIERNRAAKQQQRLSDVEIPVVEGREFQLSQDRAAALDNDTAEDQIDALMEGLKQFRKEPAPNPGPENATPRAAEDTPAIESQDEEASSPSAQDKPTGTDVTNDGKMTIAGAWHNFKQGGMKLWNSLFGDSEADHFSLDPVKAGITGVVGYLGVKAIAAASVAFPPVGVAVGLGLAGYTAYKGIGMLTKMSSSDGDVQESAFKDLPELLLTALPSLKASKVAKTTAATGFADDASKLTQASAHAGSGIRQVWKELKILCGFKIDGQVLPKKSPLEILKSIKNARGYSQSELALNNTANYTDELSTLVQQAKTALSDYELAKVSGALTDKAASRTVIEKAMNELKGKTGSLDETIRSIGQMEETAKLNGQKDLLAGSKKQLEALKKLQKEKDEVSKLLNSELAIFRLEDNIAAAEKAFESIDDLVKMIIAKPPGKSAFQRSIGDVQNELRSIKELSERFGQFKNEVPQNMFNGGANKVDTIYDDSEELLEKLTSLYKKHYPTST